MGLFDHTEEQQALTVDETVKAYLLEAARWAKFIAIFGLIIFGLMLIGGVFLLMTPAAMFAQMGMSPFGLGLLYIIMSVLYFYPMWALLKFANKIKLSVALENQAMMQDGFRFLKNHFKAVGIFIIAIIIMYILIIIFFIVVGAVAGMAS